MSGGSSHPGSALHAALYMNTMQANKVAQRQNSIGSQSCVSSMSGMNPSVASSSNRNSSAAAQALFMQQQRQHVGSSSLLMGGATNPQLAAATTSEQLLLQQQRMMAEIKRRLQHQQQAAGGSSSSPGSQRQMGFPLQQEQQQRDNSMSSTHGRVQDHGEMSLVSLSSGGSVPLAQERRSSIVNVEPISLASLLGAQDRRGSSGFGGEEHHLLPALLPAGHDMGQSHQVPSNSHLLASESQQRTPDDSIRREASIDSSTSTVKHGNRSSPSKPAAASPHLTTGSNTPTTGQAYMKGSFEGGWQSNDDPPERREVIFSIVKLMEQMRPDADKVSNK